MEDMLTFLPEQIQDAYDSCSEEEKVILVQILQELSDYGYSETYENVWLADYKEIPVSIQTFLDSDTFLGKATRQGTGVYPFWRDTMVDIFSAGNKYNECIFTGATRIGKSSTAITCAAYLLYRIMCLRDPQEFFGLKDVSVFSFLFFNITKDLAKGVAFKEFNATLQSSPWFMSHGTMSRSVSDPIYIPEGGKIVIEYGSEASHALGQQVYCLVGDTQILTPSGTYTLEDLYKNRYTSEVMAYDANSKCSVLSSIDGICLTKYVTDTIRVELEDGSIVEGTPDHRVLLSDGTYKRLGDLTDSDDILTF